MLGLIGHPVAHSLSPSMHRAALAHYGLQGDYRLVDLFPGDLDAGIGSLIVQGFCGFNVTVPHKQAVMALCSQLTEEARLVKAVNSVRIESDRTLTGHNTDLGGFQKALTEASSANFADGGKALLLGAGGAARAGLWGLALSGFQEIGIVARRTEPAQRMQEEFLDSFSSASCPYGKPKIAVLDLSAALGSERPTVIVNSTPIGLSGEAPPQWLRRLICQVVSGGLFFDMVYGATGVTPCVQAAREAGLTATDGTGMLVEQARLAFEFFTGKLPAVDVMRQAVGAL